MMLEMMVRDCLYLNWALPVDALPAPAPPLRYQVHPWQGRDWVFASALLFHQDAVHFSALPLLRFGYPQLNVRLYVLDDEGVPSVLFRRMLMPSWVAPGVRLVTHQPAAAAHLEFPRPSRRLTAEPWLWRVRRGGSLEVRAWQDSPRVEDGPRLGTWEQTVRYFYERPRGYAASAGALHRIEARHPQAAHWPVRVEMAGGEMLNRLLLDGNDDKDGQGGHAGNALRPLLHSAWLCPEIPFVFELGLVSKVQVAPGMPQPAAGRVASPVLRRSAAPREVATPERRRAAC